MQAPTVLVVDDDAMLAHIIGQLLLRQGLSVTVVNSCAEARAKTTPHKVGVFDIQLGDGDGVALARQLVVTGQITHCVFFTGGAQRELLDQASELGEVFHKGDGPAPLVTAVQALLGGVPATAAAR